MNLFDYCFKNYAYEIGCRNIAPDDRLPCDNSPQRYSILHATEKEWYADAFCIEYHGEAYVFFEIMDSLSGKGRIGVSKFENGSFSKVKTVLDEPFHLSYPNVFVINDTVYMIPESCQANQIRLYRAVKFPYEWKLEKILIDNIYAVDTSLLTGRSGQLYIYTRLNYEDGKQLWFTLDPNTFELNEFPVAGLSDERPAGNAFYWQDKLIRPLQDCSRCYGEKVKIYNILDDSDICKEEYLFSISNNSIISGKGRKYEFIHTLNRTGNIEVVDLCYKRFYITKPVRRLIQKLQGKG